MTWTKTEEDAPPGMLSDPVFLISLVEKNQVTAVAPIRSSWNVKIRSVASLTPPNDFVGLRNFRMLDDLLIESGAGDAALGASPAAVVATGESALDGDGSLGVAVNEGGWPRSAGCLSGRLTSDAFPSGITSCTPSMKPISPRFDGRGSACGRGSTLLSRGDCWISSDGIAGNLEIMELGESCRPAGNKE